MAKILWPDSMALLFEREGVRLTPVAEHFAEIVWESAVRDSVRECVKSVNIERENHVSNDGYCPDGCDTCKRLKSLATGLRQKFGVEDGGKGYIDNVKWGVLKETEGK